MFSVVILLGPFQEKKKTSIMLIFCQNINIIFLLSLCNSKERDTKRALKAMMPFDFESQSYKFMQ